MKQNFVISSIIVIMLWGILGILYKIGSKNMDYRQTVFWACVFGSFFYAITASFLGFSNVTINFKPQVLFIFFASFCGIFGFLMWIYGINKFSVKEFVAITATYPIITTILATLILHEQITITKAIGIILAVLSVVFVSI